MFGKMTNQPHAEAKALMVFLEDVIKADGTVTTKKLYAYVDGWWDLTKVKGQGGGSCTGCADLFETLATGFNFEVDVFFRFASKRGAFIQEVFRAGS